MAVSDDVTQGVIHGILGVALKRNNWNGTRSISDACVWIDTDSRQFKADSDKADEVVEDGCNPNVVHLAIRRCSELEVSAKHEGQGPVVVESVVHGFRVNSGEPLTREFRVGGEHQLVLSRVAAFSALHLWQALVADKL